MQFKVQCNKCSKNHNLDVSLDEVDSYEREMGAEAFYEGEAETVCECGNKISILVEGSEYPVGADIEINNVEVKGAKLVG